MKHKRIRQERAVKDGWSRWVQPVKRGYLLACCDCHLAHWFDFRVMANGKVQFRCKRAPRYTARERAKAGFKA